MSSLLRNFEVCSESFIKRIVNKLPCRPDFIGSFPKDCETIDNIKQLKKLSRVVNIRKVVFENDPKISSSLRYNNINNNQRHGSVGNYLQWYSMQRCLKYKNQLEKKVGEYDLVIWCRPDLFYFNDLDDVKKLSDAFWLVGHDNHLCGLNDRFCLGNSYQVGMRMNILEYFENEWYKKYSNDETILFKGENKDPQWNPEIVLKCYLKDYLNFNTQKLNLCFGKMRTENLATIPYYFSKHGNDYTGYNCVEDKYVSEINEKINNLSLEYKPNCKWGLVNIKSII